MAIKQEIQQAVPNAKKPTTRVLPGGSTRVVGILHNRQAVLVETNRLLDESDSTMGEERRRIK